MWSEKDATLSRDLRSLFIIFHSHLLSVSSTSWELCCFPISSWCPDPYKLAVYKHTFHLFLLIFHLYFVKWHRLLYAGHVVHDQCSCFVQHVGVCDIVIEKDAVAWKVSRFASRSYFCHKKMRCHLWAYGCTMSLRKSASLWFSRHLFFLKIEQLIVTTCYNCTMFLSDFLRWFVIAFFRNLFLQFRKSLQPRPRDIDHLFQS